MAHDILCTNSDIYIKIFIFPLHWWRRKRQSVPSTKGNKHVLCVQFNKRIKCKCNSKSYTIWLVLCCRRITVPVSNIIIRIVVYLVQLLSCSTSRSINEMSIRGSTRSRIWLIARMSYMGQSSFLSKYRCMWTELLLQNSKTMSRNVSMLGTKGRNGLRNVVGWNCNRPIIREYKLTKSRNNNMHINVYEYRYNVVSIMARYWNRRNTRFSTKCSCTDCISRSTCKIKISNDSS